METTKFKINDLVRDIEGDTYRVLRVRVWTDGITLGSTLDIETTEGTKKTLTGVPAHFFTLKPKPE